MYIHTMEYCSSLKGIKSYYMLQRGWTLKALSWNKPVTKGQILYDCPQIVVKFIETESRKVIAGGWGRGNGSCLMGIKFQTFKLKKF